MLLKEYLKKRIICYIFFPAILSGTMPGYSQDCSNPFSFNEILELRSAGATESMIAEYITQAGVHFESSADVIRSLNSELLLQVIESNRCPDLQAPILEGTNIVSPLDDTRSGRYVSVRGTSQSIEDHHLWLFATREGMRVWWPQIDEIAVNENGTWVQGAYLGGPQDVGFRFNLTVLWVNDSTNRYLHSYLQNGNLTGHYPGINLPQGVHRTSVRIKKVSH